MPAATLGVHGRHGVGGLGAADLATVGEHHAAGGLGDQHRHQVGAAGAERLPDRVGEGVGDVEVGRHVRRCRSGGPREGP